MTNQTLAQSIDEDVANISALVRYSRQNGLKPMVCVVNPSPEQNPECAVMCVYAAEMTRVDDGKERTVPLVPYFYHYSVASTMVARHMLNEVHVSRRTGVQVHWCEFTDKVR